MYGPRHYHHYYHGKKEQTGGPLGLILMGWPIVLLSLYGVVMSVFDAAAYAKISGETRAREQLVSYYNGERDFPYTSSNSDALLIARECADKFDLPEPDYQQGYYNRQLINDTEYMSCITTPYHEQGKYVL